MTPEKHFARIAKKLRSNTGVTSPPDGARSSGFDSNALKINGKIFVMLASGRLVVKLSRERVKQLVDSGYGERFDPRSDGRLMKEWLSIDPKSDLGWLDLGCEAMKFVDSQKGGNER